MGFWFFMLAMVLLIPLSMLFLGRYFIRHSPTKINYVFGYRTRMSMKNQDTWQFAHRHFGKTWYVCGLVFTPLSVLGMLLVLGKDENAVGISPPAPESVSELLRLEVKSLRVQREHLRKSLKMHRITTLVLLGIVALCAFALVVDILSPTVGWFRA